VAGVYSAAVRVERDGSATALAERFVEMGTVDDAFS